MPIKKYKPTSPGRRFMSSRDLTPLTKKKRPEKRLVEVAKLFRTRPCDFDGHRLSQYPGRARQSYR